LIEIADLPLVNATLNAISAALLTAGYAFIRRRRIAQHRACMLAAFGASTLFLLSYLIYHSAAGSRPFPGSGTIRIVYFLVLVPHVILAAAVLPLSLMTLSRALRGRYPEHRAIARWTLPIWLYVSVTGVIVYLMLYQLH
jgi:uncharacterized membrane protein YozB (DUF420 family)